MVRIDETELPGVGRKYTMPRTQAGEKLVLVLHHGGRREIYRFRTGSEDPDAVISLSDEEARQMAAILGGSFFQPVRGRELDMALPGLVLEWVRVEPASTLVGTTLGDQRIRTRTGVTVVAVVREGRTIPNPTVDLTLLEGDTLVTVGSREQLRSLRELLSREG